MVTATMIKVGIDTKGLLQNLKIVRKESYDEVIQRLIQYFAENQSELNPEIKKIILEWMKNLKEERVKSINQILEATKKDNEKKDPQN